MSPVRRILSAIGVALLGLCAGPGQAACQKDAIDLRGPWGQAHFRVEIMETAEERAQGLMFRRALPRHDGMLFVYEHPQRVAFWMKNTLIPLDMIFLSEDGTVTHIHEGAVPGDLTPIPGGDDVLVVLEVNAGIVSKYGITPGSQMRHEVFSSHDAIWPC